MNRDEVKARLLESVEQFIGVLPPEGNLNYILAAFMTADGQNEYRTTRLDGAINRLNYAVNTLHLLQDLSEHVLPRGEKGA